MQITRQSEYAVKTMLELASTPPREYMRTVNISKRQDIPEVFLQKTLQLLARAGLVTTKRGANGGVALNLPAHEITIATIIEAIEGEFAINPCLRKDNHCPNEASCQIRPILKRAQDAMRQELSKETLQDLLDQRG